MLKVISAKIKELNMREKGKVRVISFIIKINIDVIVKINEIITPKFSPSHILLPAFTI